ncbi:MAG: sugar ABC transporter permease [Clostridia bacterium]|nr:sugar ABC transporter permease [Clostridia bacterium]
MIFYILMMAFPVVQFAVFYIGVNGGSFLLSFQNIDITTNTTTWTFQNLSNVFKMMTRDAEILSMAGMSLLSYALILFIGTPLGLLFSYYIYKKLPISGAFRVILFLPSIVSAIVMVTIFQFFVERAVPEIIKVISGKQIEGLLENQNSRFATVIFYNIWVGFGTSVLMYANGMGGISQEIVESAHLDGATGIREFWHITLPMVFPTLSTFIITGVATIFTNQLNLYSFYGDRAPGNVQTYGYYLYNKTQAATSRAEYPELAAMGLLLTLIAVPLTLVIKWALEKFGPQAE